jgi:hypothetical protein
MNPGGSLRVFKVTGTSGYIHDLIIFWVKYVVEVAIFCF